jgi:quercetin dioxygenase-like cupin family protein
MFECLVGAHNKTRGLTTGFATLAPKAQLPYHTHPCGESITLVRGRAAVWVEGRHYTVSPFDNVTVPRGVAHGVVNLSDSAPAIFHVALASESPTRELVEWQYGEYAMSDLSEGSPPFERVTRFKSASRFEAGPNTEFIDYFNRELMPGIEMSGGYGRFRPGGRLPAHFHDFDESICISEGTATCIVEGRRYSLSDGATAMVPRGRVHYFINESNDLMSMIWVYAGPMPERIVVDESCATVEGDPWRV